MKVFKKINMNILQMDKLIDPNKNFDLIKRNVVIGGKESCLYYVDGFIKDEIFQEVMRFMMLTKPEEMCNVKNYNEYTTKLLPYMEISNESDFDNIVNEVLAGCVALFIDNIEEAIIIDVRQYPQRQVEEPQMDKVLRGARDGFIETPVFNAALIRRRIRNANFTLEHMEVGSDSKTDVIVCYMDDRVDKNKLKLIKDKILNVKVKSLDFGSQSLIEALVPKHWFNPFPKVQHTERPDIAAANILEGRIVILVDNCPAAVILPTTFWDYFQEAEDFYFAPTVANYLRFSRYLLVLLTVFVTPLWLLAVNNIEKLPEWLSFLKIQEMNNIPIIIQLIVLEFIINALKAASINTPSMISNSISLIGAVILGDIVVSTKLILPEAMIYTAFVAIGYYSQPSFELGYAFKFIRIMLLILVQFFNVYGFIAGIVIMCLTIGFNKTLTGDSYIYPLIPFNFKDLKKALFRPKNA